MKRMGHVSSRSWVYFAALWFVSYSIFRDLSPTRKVCLQCPLRFSASDRRYTGSLSGLMIITPPRTFGIWGTQTVVLHSPGKNSFENSFSFCFSILQHPPPPHTLWVSLPLVVPDSSEEREEERERAMLKNRVCSPPVSTDGWHGTWYDVRGHTQSRSQKTCRSATPLTVK